MNGFAVETGKKIKFMHRLLARIVHFTDQPYTENSSYYIFKLEAIEKKHMTIKDWRASVEDSSSDSSDDEKDKSKEQAKKKGDKPTEGQ